MKKELRIDQEFVRLCTRITQGEMEKLEHSLIMEGCHEPIIVWKGLILDGHKRYRICTYEDIDFEIKEVFLENRDEVIIYICRTRIKGLEKNSAIFRFLMGKWYNCQKKINHIQKKTEPQKEAERYSLLTGVNGHHDRASVQIATELGVHRATVEKYGGYTTALEAIYEKEPSLFNAIIAGEVSFKYKEVRELMHLEQKDLYRVLKKQLKTEYIKMRHRPPQKKEDGAVDEVPLAIKVKEMPAFDPDMALKGLALTIPMWISSITRAQQQTDMSLATDDGKMKLIDMLLKLDEQIKKTLEALGW